MTPTLRAALDALGVVPAPQPALAPPSREHPPPWRPRFAGDQPPF